MPRPAAAADSIHIEQMELSVRIGVPEEERAQPQRLGLSLTLWPLASFATLQDQIGNAVNYATVCDELKSFVAGRSDQLIETLAEAIASHLLARQAIARVRVELRKYVLPNVQHVAVILTRERTEGR